MDKIKEINGRKEELLRFISILAPINSYMRKMSGDSWLLPQISQPGGMILKDDEWVWVNGEDLMSCFNLLCLPTPWRKYMSYSKTVDAGVVGGKAGVQTHVAIAVCPMGVSENLK